MLVGQETERPEGNRPKDVTCTPNKRLWTLWLILAIAGFALFSNSLSVPFWEDDFIYLRQDLERSLDRMFGHVERGTQTYWFYRPFVEVSWSLEYLIWGKSPAAFRITNILLHLAVTVLMSILLSKLLEVPSWVAFVAGAVFLCHPANQCTVVWLSNRFELFYTFFYLLSFLCFIEYRGRRGRLPHYILSVLFFALSILSKENAITLPAVLLLYELLLAGPRARLKKSRVVACLLRLLPFVLICALALLRRVLAYGGEAFVHYRGTDSWLLVVNILRHIKWALLPFKALDLAEFAEVFFLQILLLLVAVVAFSFTHKRKAAFLIGFVILTSLPILNQSGLRHIYLPLVGVIPLVLISVLWVLQFIQDWTSKRGVHYTGMGTTIYIAVLMTFAFLWAASIPGHGKIIPEVGLLHWIANGRNALIGLALLLVLTLVRAKTFKLKMCSAKIKPSVATLLPVVAIISVFAGVTFAYNGQNVEWGKGIWRVYSSLDTLSLPVKDGAEIYVVDPPSSSHLTPIAFHYYPRQVLVDDGIEGFYYNHRYGETIASDMIFFLAFDDGQLVLSEDLKNAVLTRFDLRKSAQFKPIEVCWTSRSWVPGKLSDCKQLPGEIRADPGKFVVSRIDIPVSLLDTLVLSFDGARTGAEIMGRFEWQTGEGADARQEHFTDFTGRAKDDGLLSIDLALVAQWLETRSIVGFSVEYGSDEPSQLTAVALSSEKLKPRSRFIEITLPKGKTFSRAPQVVIRDLLREVK